MITETPLVVTSEELAKRAPILRARILRMVNAAGAGHPGGSLSVIDMLAVLLMAWGRFRPHAPIKDWLVLGKGHAAPAYYAVLTELGYLDESELFTYRQLGTRLQGHPDRRKLPAVQVTTGHLGHGLSIGVGIALGEKMSNSDKKVYVILGDGDLHEGQTWSAAMAAAHFALTNLIALVDLNGLSQHGDVKRIMNFEPLAAKWEAFGWRTVELDGHDYQQILSALASVRDSDRPCALLCRTIKGKGVSFMEGDPLWHSRDLPDDLLERALQELGVDR
jgi:transketolase